MQNNIFSQAAKKETTLSRVMEGRTKIDTNELIDAYPNGVTICEFDFIELPNETGDVSVFPVFAFTEDTDACFFGGTVLTKIARRWIDLFDGDVDKASAELQKAGGVHIKLTAKRTKRGNNITQIVVE